jgi:Peroxiredoxin
MEQTKNNNNMEQTSQMPLIGDPAPDFVAMTTQGEITFSEYIKDHWAILFSHPADFTPVCTTELSGFAERARDFEKLNTKLIGLSIDSIHSHIAWVNDVWKKMGVLMEFPIIADIDMYVAKLYGMLQPNASHTQAVRAVFFIDPKSIIRLIMYYPLNVGRNMNEIFRVLVAMQTDDKYSVATPLNWKPGDAVIVSAPKTVKELESRENDTDLDVKTWYLAMKDVRVKNMELVE